MYNKIERELLMLPFTRYKCHKSMKLLIWHHLTEHANDPSELGSGVLLSFLALLVDPFQLS